MILFLKVIASVYFYGQNKLVKPSVVLKNVNKSFQRCNLVIIAKNRFVSLDNVKFGVYGAVLTFKGAFPVNKKYLRNLD